MDFLIVTALGLCILFVIAVIIEWLDYELRRLFYRWLYWRQSRRRSWPSVPTAYGFKLRRKSGAVTSLGRLRVTKSRYESLRSED